MSHIVKQAGTRLEVNGLSPRGTREVVLWLMFGCNYTNRILALLGPDTASRDEQMMSVLASLKELENALPHESVA